MKRFVVNIILLIVALILLATIGLYGAIYMLLFSLWNIRTVSFFGYWGNVLYAINVAIDRIGNVLLGEFLNKYAVIWVAYPFGNVNDTISYALARNIDNLSGLGELIVSILELIDPGHMEKSLKI